VRKFGAGLDRFSRGLTSPCALDNVVRWHTIFVEGGIRKRSRSRSSTKTSEGEVATIKVSAGGAALFVMGEIKEDGKKLVVSGVHISTEGVNPNEVGVRNLRQLVRAIMEIAGYDEIVVEGAIRTTGAHPGRRPHSIRFSRDRLFAPDRKPQ
jgi:hypothetical protein